MTRSAPRVGLLGYFHESNSFAARAADAAEVRRRRLDGDAILREHEGSGTAIAGYLDAAAQLGWDLVPMTYIELVPSAPLDAEAGRAVRDALRAAVRSEPDLDMLVLAMHGAAVTADELDFDGALLEMVRAETSAQLPIGVTLDLHANVSDRVVAAADVTVGYRSNPHVDPRERGAETARILHDAWQRGIRPAAAIERIPVLMGILTQGTADEPWISLVAAADLWRAQPGVLAVSLFQGFPWADVPQLGMSVVVHTDPEVPTADAAEIAADLSRRVRARRELFRLRPLNSATALDAAPEGETTLILDVGDNIGAGGSGARTDLLEIAIIEGRRSFVCIVCDPGAAEAAAASGVGSEIGIDLGEGRIRVLVRVLAVSDGRYEDAGPTHVGHRYFDAGPSAALALSTGQTVVVASRAILPSSPEQLRHLGVEPTDFEIIAAKGVHSPLAGYRPIVDRVVFADTSGATADDFTLLPYRHRPRPLFPLDPELIDPEPHDHRPENESADA